MAQTQLKERLYERGRGDRRGGRDGWNPGGRWEGAFPVPTPKIGLWIFFAVPTLLFSALVSAYIARMGLSDWRPLPEPKLLWVNTGFLILSSMALQWAVYKARRGRSGRMRLGLFVGGALAMLFIGGQVWAWQQLRELGYFMATNPSSSFFYLITALHGLHLLGGLVAWGRTMKRAWRGAQEDLSIELCAVYWHFLLLVWLVLFGLMLIT